MIFGVGLLKQAIEFVANTLLFLFILFWQFLTKRMMFLSHSDCLNFDRKLFRHDTKAFDQLPKHNHGSSWCTV